LNIIKNLSASLSAQKNAEIQYFQFFMKSHIWGTKWAICCCRRAGL